MQYVVMCRVSGGVTGTREAILRKDGATCYFDSMADAAAEAARLEREANERAQSAREGRERHALPYQRTATFAYWAVPA